MSAMLSRGHRSLGEIWAARVSLPDVRMPLVGLAAWAGALVGLASGRLLAVTVAAAAVAAVGLVRWRRSVHASAPRAVPPWATVATLALVCAAVGLGAHARVARVADNPVASLAAERSAVRIELVVTGDPRVVHGRFADLVLVPARTVRVTSRAAAYDVSVPVLLVTDGAGADAAGADWGHAGPALGERWQFGARLAPSDDADRAAVVHPLDRGHRLQRPAWWWRSADAVRAALRASVGLVPADRRPLVPALVVGDDRGLDEALADDFRTTGLTHLLAVSGTNLTLVLGFVLMAARGIGVRGRGLYAVGAAGVVGFVLLARPEPSVLRAAVMGSVALVGLGSGGRRRGGRSLGVAVTGLLLVDPWLAPTAGFTLSVLATGGIVFVAPVWRDALAAWQPRWLAEAIAVPAAAQLACTPVVAALSGQVSLVAVAANLLAAPAVGPATVLGLGGGLAGLVWPGLGLLVGRLAGWCVGWIVFVARSGAALPVPALGWGADAGALVLLTIACVLLWLVAPWCLRRPSAAGVCCLLLTATVLIRPPTPGWPPPGWVLAMCDVGQGDALVLNAGPGAGVVVDAGPDAALVDDCLRRLDVHEVPLVVLTHFHADHVDGLAGIARGRRLSEVQVTSLADPPGAVLAVAALARRLGVPETVAGYAATRQVGEVTLQVLWPLPLPQETGSPESGSPESGPQESGPQGSVPQASGPVRSGPGDGSTANNASVVLLAQVRGVRILLTGDIEPAGQEVLARSLPGLQVDVLKVPHHGSRFQDLPFLTSLGAAVALVSVGADNDYGHPSRDTLDALTELGVEVGRTDRDGDLVVIERDGRLSLVRRG